MHIDKAHKYESPDSNSGKNKMSINRNLAWERGQDFLVVRVVAVHGLRWLPKWAIGPDLVDDGGMIGGGTNGLVLEAVFLHPFDEFL